MSLGEIVFLFTVSGLWRSRSRSVSASLHLCGGRGGGAPGAGRFLTVLKALSARRDASAGFVSLLVSTSGRAPFVCRRSICIRLQLQHVGAPAFTCASFGDPLLAWPHAMSRTSSGTLVASTALEWCSWNVCLCCCAAAAWSISSRSGFAAVLKEGEIEV